jgi:hypothetical protein
MYLPRPIPRRATSEVGRLRDRVDAAEACAKTAHETAEELRRADAVRRGRGLAARLLAAWRRR